MSIQIIEQQIKQVMEISIYLDNELLDYDYIKNPTYEQKISYITRMLKNSMDIIIDTSIDNFQQIRNYLYQMYKIDIETLL